MAVNTPGIGLVLRVFRAESHDAVELIEGVRAGRLARALGLSIIIWRSCWRSFSTTMRPSTSWCRWKLY
jgi:hypothetical protein